MTRCVLTVNLKDDPAGIQTYREYHGRVWPEVLDSLRSVGVERMDIHLLGQRLVMVIELTGDLDVRRALAAHVSSSPRVGEWERLMKSLQEPCPEAAPGEWWALMEPVFQLEAAEPAVAHGADRSRIS
jgi:L-rhamnose mutarotase